MKAIATITIQARNQPNPRSAQVKNTISSQTNAQ